jgi:hypothetical protein
MFNTQRRLRFFKTIPLMVLTLILISNIAAAVAIGPVDTHLDSIAQINCEQGDVVSVTSQLWIENICWDNPLTGEDLYFYVYEERIDNNNNILFQKIKETSWPTGKASLKVNTKNFKPGNYTLIVHYDGGGDLLDYEDCSTKTKFNVMTKSNKTA